MSYCFYYDLAEREGLTHLLRRLTPSGRLRYATASCGAVRLVERSVSIKASLSAK
ncbi:MAG: hypothetical protein ABW176_17810 [Candidatus Thiodiazotropha endolucinida]